MLNGYEKALLTLGSTPMNDPFALAYCLNMFGRMWGDLDRDEEGLACYQRAFEIVQRCPERNSTIGLEITFGLAAHLTTAGKLDEAEAILKAHYEPIRRKFGPGSWQVAFWIDSLSRVRLCQERYAEAERLNRQALTIAERECKSNVPWLVCLWHGLANSLAARENWTEAEDCYCKALRLCEEFYAPDHPSIARLLDDYADLLERLSRFEEAQVHQHRAQQIREFHSPFRIV